MPTRDREPTCSVEDCIITGELERRPSRPPDYEAENHALTALADTLARRPGDVLQRLTDLMLELDLGDSAGISLSEGEGADRIFRWVALSGQWGQFKGGTMPFSASPCGVVVTRHEVMLFKHPERAFPDANVDPLIKEILLVPFAINGDAIGTVWANAHSDHRKFNREDARLLKGLSRFASAAHQMVAALGESEHRLQSTDAVLRESEQRLTTELSGSHALQGLSTRLIPEQSPEALYDQILDTALELMGADAASLQLLDDDGKRLRRVATRNLHPFSTEYWTWVDASHASTCGQALSKNKRVVVEDVEASAELVGTGDLEAFRASGTRAVQSTPLLTRAGRPIGMISTHWRAPRRIEETDLGLFDVLARQIADLFERAKTEVALRESEERQAFLLKLGDAMRAERDADEVIAVASRLLGEHLGASRVIFCEIDESAGVARLSRGWHAHGAAPHPASLNMADFGGPLLDDLRAGRPVRYDDVGEQPYARPDLAALAAIGIRAGLSVPLLISGEFVVNLNVHQEQPRRWTDAEVDLVTDVAERLWAAVVRARAEGALAASEEKYRTIFDSIDEGFALIEVIFDEGGKPVDLLHLETNPAYERHTGLRDVVGKRALEIAPDFDPMWFDFYGEIARTGEAARTEYHVAAPVDRWFTLHGSRVGGEGSRKIAVVFNDVTEQRRADDALRESEERQAFLLTLSDALRAEPDADSIAMLALRSLTERLQLDRCYVAEYRLDEDKGDIPYQVGNDKVPPLPEYVRLSDFPEALEIAVGRTLVIDNVAEADFLSDADKRNMQALGMQALVTGAARKGENLPVFAIVAVSAVPRSWTAGEIALIEEVNERAWAAIERARAEAALRESEEKYRTLFNSIDEGVCTLDLIFDETDTCIDFVYGEHNPMLTELTGLRDVEGKRVSEVIPDMEPAWLERFGQVALTGEPARFEEPVEPIGRWFDIYVSRVGGKDSRRVVVVYSNVTERKVAEAALRESEERQAFLLAIGDAMRAESSADGKIAAVARLLGEKLGASRVLYAEYDHEEGVAHIFNGWLADGAQPFPPVVKLKDFEGEALNDLREGRVVRVDDVGRLGAESGYAAIAKVGVQALLSPPLLVDGKLKFNVSIHQSEPRHWTGQEVALVQEVSERLWAEIVRTRADTALRDSERHANLLLAELQHRVRNTLAVVRSIARRTAEKSTSAEDMLAHFQGRLDAFSRVQAALTRSPNATVDLASLIEDELVAYAAREGAQVRIKGPEVALEPKTAERLSLAIHELTTNAVKHGALTDGKGRIRVGWTHDDDRLVLKWKESGVDHNGRKLEREGFGMELLKRSLPYDLQAETTVELEPDGLRFMLDMPYPSGS